MAVTESDVRKLLDQLASKQVTTNTINANIADALSLVDRFVQVDADPVLKDAAQKRIALWLSYISYSEAQSFSQGATPMISKDKINSYRNIAELYLNLISEEAVDLENIRRTDAENKEAGLPNISFTGTTAFEA